MEEQIEERKLVDAHGLLDALFDETSRPSLRWIRQMQVQRKFPYYKLGHLVRFDVDEVKKVIQEEWCIQPRTRK